MNELIDFIRAHRVEIVSICLTISSIATAVASLFAANITAKSIRKAKSRGTFTICPHCHKAIPLSDLDFRLPDGSIDNNLNGEPDEKERTFKK